MKKTIIVILIVIFSITSFASELSLDVGQTTTNFNRFSIPKSQDNQLSFKETDALTSYRLTAFINLANNNQLYFLYAPLEVSYDFTSNKNFTFNKTNFVQGQKTSAKYKFNSYRVGYMWNYGQNALKYWLGVVAKIRDADISISQGSNKDNYDNIGVVPLFSLGFEFDLLSTLSIYSHTDALGSSRGSAYDSQLELKWKLNDISASIGKRILGGGADNDRVYNFAQFDTNYVKLTYRF